MNLFAVTREASCKRFGIIIAACLLAAALANPAFAQRKKGGSPSIIPGGNAKAPVSIDAERLEYLQAAEDKFVYSGNVIAKQGDATLKAPKMTIFLVKDAAKGAGAAPSEGGMNDKIKRIETTGPVTVTSKDQSGKVQVGTGDKGLYDKARNKVFLIGNPVLTQEGNIVRGAPGQTLEYDLNSGQAVFTGTGRVQSIFTPGSEDKIGGATPRKPTPKPAAKPEGSP